VVDDKGEPVAGASVAVARLTGFGFQPSPAAARSTDGSGEFRIPNLLPDRYLILASPPRESSSVPAAEATTRDTDKPEQALLPTYYPNGTDPAQAVAVSVGPGQEAPGINITLRRGELFRIRGRVLVTAPGLAMSDIAVRLYPRRPTFQFLNAPTGQGGVNPNADGYFELPGVEPGRYYLTAVPASGRGGARGRVSVELLRADADDVVLSVGERMQLSGTARMEGQENTRLETVSIFLLSEDGTSRSASTKIGSNGSFKIVGVLPDCYLFGVSGLPKGAYLKSVRVGGHDALEACLDLSQVQPTAAVEVVFSPNSATVEGIVKRDGKPAPGRYVNLVLDPPRPEPLDLLKSATSDQYGRFTFTSVAPGNYRLYAWDEQPIGLFIDPEFPRQFESPAVKVTVKENDRVKAEVTVIKSEDATQ
jgi:hypothetical protein